MADEIDGEYPRPDAEKAFKIYDEQIAPKLEHLATIKGDLSGPWGDVKNCNFPKKVMSFIIALEDMEDAKRDHFLTALHEGFRIRGITMPRDLVSIANGQDQSNVIPIGNRADDELLVDAADDEDGAGTDAKADDFEASEAELEKQEGRKRRTARPAGSTSGPKKASVSSIAPLH